MDNIKRHLLGIMPRYIWDEKRIEALCDAIIRYIQHDKIDENVKEWIEELINFYPTNTVDEIIDKIKHYVMEDYLGYFRNLIIYAKQRNHIKVNEKDIGKEIEVQLFEDDKETAVGILIDIVDNNPVVLIPVVVGDKTTWATIDGKQIVSIGEHLNFKIKSRILNNI